MKFFFIIFIFIVTINCSGKPKAIFICGDRECVNKLEAEQYFEKNLSIEVKILERNKKKKVDLIELNMNRSQNSKTVNINRKNNTKKDIKILSPKEIKRIKSKIKKRERDENKIQTASKKLKKIDKPTTKNQKIKNVVKEDICTILEKCSIEEISKYLIKEGLNKKFPDITARE